MLFYLGVTMNRNIMLFALIAFGVIFFGKSEAIPIPVSDDHLPNYKISLNKTKTLIHIDGPIKSNLVSEVRIMLKKYPTIKTILLDSRGGNARVGKQLSNLIFQFKLKTISAKGCYSACTDAFIAGTKRYLVKGAKLGFHQAGSMIPKFVSAKERKFIEKGRLGIEEHTKNLYRQQGVPESFVSQMHKAPYYDIWFPTTDELIKSKVIHGLIDKKTM